MADKKTILEEALMDAQTIQNALNANTREILRSVAREEIDGLVKESLLKEEGFEEEDLDADVDVAEPEMELGAEPDFGGDADLDLDDESDAGEMGDSLEVGPEMDQDLGMDADALGGEDLDMTDASDDDVISIYKKLSGEDEIEIVGDDIHLNVSEPGEYVVKGAGVGVADATGVDDMDSEEFSDEDLEEVPTGAEDMGDEDDSEYEIELDGDDAEGDEFGGAEDEELEADVEDEDEDEDPIEEQISQNRVAQNRAGGDLTQIKGTGAKHAMSENVTYKKLVLENNPKYKALITESSRLKNENDQFRQALAKFRGMLVETVVFNSNLSYVTKLFMEHSTTKAEKMNIIAKFDEEVSNLKESKRLYKTIANDLSGRKPIAESVETKINKVATGSSSKILNENTVYVDASTQRIKDLMRRVDKK